MALLILFISTQQAISLVNITEKVLLKLDPDYASFFIDRVLLST
jgi:hypothetical protein